MRFRANLLTILVSGVLATACHNGSAETKVVGDPAPARSKAMPSPIPEPDVSVDNFISKLEEIEKEKITGLGRAWARVSRKSDFRIARSGDFGEPQLAYNYGEIAGAYGLALIVVDKTKSVDTRYGLIVFIERPGNRYDTYWIYRDTNLQSFSMSRASGDIFVEEKLRDGGSKLCEIQWIRQKGTWTCEPLLR